MQTPSQCNHLLGIHFLHWQMTTKSLTTMALCQTDAQFRGSGASRAGTSPHRWIRHPPFLALSVQSGPGNGPVFHMLQQSPSFGPLSIGLFQRRHRRWVRPPAPCILRRHISLRVGKTPWKARCMFHRDCRLSYPAESRVLRRLVVKGSRQCSRSRRPSSGTGPWVDVIGYEGSSSRRV